MMKRLPRFFILAVLALVCGCAACGARKNTPSLDEATVISIANEAAKESGADLAKFKPPQAYFEYVEPNCTWAVFYEGIEPIIGNHFLVVVNDRTRNARVSGGL